MEMSSTQYMPLRKIIILPHASFLDLIRNSPPPPPPACGYISPVSAQMFFLVHSVERGLALGANEEAMHTPDSKQATRHKGITRLSLWPTEHLGR